MLGSIVRRIFRSGSPTAPAAPDPPGPFVADAWKFLNNVKLDSAPTASSAEPFAAIPTVRPLTSPPSLATPNRTTPSATLWRPAAAGAAPSALVTSFLGRLPGPRAVRTRARVVSSRPVSYVGANCSQAFADIESVVELGQYDGPHRLCLAPALPKPEPVPLFSADDLPPDIVLEYKNCPPAPPVYVYGLPEHEIGGLGFVQANGKVFFRSDTVPEYFLGFLGERAHTLPQQWLGALVDPAAEIIEVDGPVAMPMHPNLIYGHFLLEMFPKLYILSLLRSQGLPLMIALPTEIAQWAKNIVSLYFDASEVVYYDARTQRVRPTCVVLPSMMHTRYNFHPMFNQAVGEVRDFVLPRQKPGPRPSLIWLSRSKQPGWHGMDNENEVEDVAASFGFTIVHPQDFSFPEQIAMFDAARCVAGEYGSGMHNTMFSRPGTRVFCVNRINWYQDGIAHVRSQRMCYLPPSDGKFRDWRFQGKDGHRFHVNCKKLEEKLGLFLREKDEFGNMA